MIPARRRCGLLSDYFDHYLVFHVPVVPVSVMLAAIPCELLSSVYLLSRRRGVVVSGFCSMNEVNPRRARLVLEWVTVFGWVYHLGV